MTTWVGTASNRVLAGLGFVLAAVFLLLTFRLWGEVPLWVSVLILVIGLAEPILGHYLSRIRVEVADDAVRFFWGNTRRITRRIPWTEVVSVEAYTVRPSEWFGWGYRVLPGMKASAIVVRGGEGIEFELRNGRRFAVSVDDAAAGAVAAQHALAASRHS